MKFEISAFNLRPALLVAFLIACVTNLALAQSVELRVNGDRLNATMAHMKTFGSNEAGGSNRVAYSADNHVALSYLFSLMLESGLTPRMDVAGNLVGRREGSVAGLSPIVTGSHIDTVPNGGHYDGIVGAMGAIEVARTLHEADVATDHPLEVIIWSNEEGGKTGSRSINGSVEEWEMDLPGLGDKTLGAGIQYIGGNPDRLAENIRQPGEIAALIELHVEQGAILDREGISIGVVEGIVGIRRWNITIDGFANHAGTTPMDQRQDALLAAAILITEIRKIVTDGPGRQVGTVGRIEAFPGAPNVVPGKVAMSLEIRDLEMQKIAMLFDRIEATSQKIAANTNTEISIEQYYESPAAITDERIKKLVNDSADALGLSSMHMPSGAGHDAQSLKGIAPLGMIFVPSVEGISHAPTEFTTEKDITNGANVLLLTVLGLDKLLN